MAVQVKPIRFCDITGTPDAVNHEYSVNGTKFEIDLDPDNSEKFEAATAAHQEALAKAEAAYEAALAKAEAAHAKTMEPYTEVARIFKPIKSGPKRTSSAPIYRPAAQQDAILAAKAERARARDWLREHGYEPAERGSIKAEHMDIYRDSLRRPAQSPVQPTESPAKGPGKGARKATKTAQTPQLFSGAA